MQSVIKLDHRNLVITYVTDKGHFYLNFDLEMRANKRQARVKLITYNRMLFWHIHFRQWR